MLTIQIPVHGCWRIAEGNEALEEFPKVFFNVSDEDIASLKGPAGRVSGHCQLMRLNLSGPSLRRRCHKSVMSIVMEASSCHQNGPGGTFDFVQLYVRNKEARNSHHLHP